MREEAFRKLKLRQAGLELKEEVYSEDLAPIRVDVYADERNHRLYHLDKRLRRYRYADSKIPAAAFGPWTPLEQ